jgi:lysozyme family protein
LRPKPTDSEEQKASKRRRLRAMKSNFRQLKQETELCVFTVSHVHDLSLLVASLFA